MNGRSLTAAVLLAALPAAARAQFSARTIYGNDDRLDLYQVQDPRLLALADADVAVFDDSDLTIDRGQAKLGLVGVYGEKLGLCRDERFWEQKYGAWCSGALVGPDLVLTSGHCVTGALACSRIRFVFGFAIKDQDGMTPEAVPLSEVYACAAVVARKQADDGADWALVRLDRVVPNHKPLTLDTAAVRKGMPLFVIGHPNGLATKIAAGAGVRDDRPEGYFTANLDVLAGSAGSPVFNAETGRVVGVVARGDDDFVRKGTCDASRRCPDDGCGGEQVSRLDGVAARLPAGDPGR